MLPSIDKQNRIPTKPVSDHVHKITQTDNLKARDYAYEMDRVLEREEHRKHGQPFGEDTFEHDEQPEEPPDDAKAQETTDPSGGEQPVTGDDENLDITV